MSANAIETLRSQIDSWVPGGGSPDACRERAFDALAAVETLLEAAKRLAPKAAFGVSAQVAVKNGDLIRLAAAVHRVEAGQ